MRPGAPRHDPVTRAPGAFSAILGRLAIQEGLRPDVVGYLLSPNRFWGVGSCALGSGPCVLVCFFGSPCPPALGPRSAAICHLPPVTCHPSSAICHLLPPATCHLASATCHLSSAVGPLCVGLGAMRPRKFCREFLPPPARCPRSAATHRPPATCHIPPAFSHQSSVICQLASAVGRPHLRSAPPMKRSLLTTDLDTSSTIYGPRK